MSFSTVLVVPQVHPESTDNPLEGFKTIMPADSAT